MTAGVVSVEAIAAASEVPPDRPDVAAEAAGLVYVSGDEPGVRRIRRGKGFSYRRPDGTTVPRGPERDRIEQLAIPPAWTDVWICPDPAGHLQATGRDDRGRKQYRYHDRWREIRDATKFHQLEAFGRRLPAVRERVDAGLRKRTHCRERALALMVGLLDASLVRVGSRAYERENDTYGLTTIGSEHVEVNSRRVRLAFASKGGQDREIEVRDRRLARHVAGCLERDGGALFSYETDGGLECAVHADDVNDWLHDVTGDSFSAKYFRTWGGTVVAAAALWRGSSDGPDVDGAVLTAMDAAAERLGNTRAVARQSYVHPKVPAAYRAGQLERHFGHEPRPGLDGDEEAVLRILDAAW